MARISEVYLSTLAARMKVHGMERHFRLLLFIAEYNGQLNQAELALKIRRDKVATMRALSTLEDGGFIERLQDKSDKRCQLIVLSNKGEKLIPILNNAILETNQTLFGHLPKIDAENFAVNMRMIMEHLSSLPEPEYIIQPQKRRK